MDHEALEVAYPELKTLISMAHVNPFAQLFKSETERANDHYLLDRYFLLDSQKMLSWRDPAFQTKYDYYIIEEGIDPFTGKPATQEEINRVKNIKKVRAFTDTLQLASTLYTNYVGYNQYYNKPYTTFSDVFSKVKGEIPVFNRKLVIPEVNLKVDINGKTITETTGNSYYHLSYFYYLVEDHDFSEYIPYLKHFLATIMDKPEDNYWRIHDTLKLLLKVEPDYVTQLLKEKQNSLSDFGLEDGSNG